MQINLNIKEDDVLNKSILGLIEGVLKRTTRQELDKIFQAEVKRLIIPDRVEAIVRSRTKEMVDNLIKRTIKKLSGKDESWVGHFTAMEHVIVEKVVESFTDEEKQECKQAIINFIKEHPEKAFQKLKF